MLLSQPRAQQEVTVEQGLQRLPLAQQGLSILIREEQVKLLVKFVQKGSIV